MIRQCKYCDQTFHTRQLHHRYCHLLSAIENGSLLARITSVLVILLHQNALLRSHSPRLVLPLATLPWWIGRMLGWW